MAAEAPIEGLAVAAPGAADLEKGLSSTISKESKERKTSSQTASQESAATAVQPEIDLSDPTLPMNWSIGKKYFNLTVPAILTFVV